MNTCSITANPYATDNAQLMLGYIDNYCERLSPGLFAEPLNALTNAAFFIAGLLAFRLAQKQGALDWRNLLLIALIFTIGTGSTLFHIFAQVWAMLTDALPILFYQIAFIVLYAQKIMRLSCRRTPALLGLFLLLTAAFMQAPREWLNGSLEYAPALIFLSGFALWHRKNAATEKNGLLLAAGIFTVSLTFRSLDNAICAALPIGTHFLWHTLNGLLLYLTTRAYILNANKMIKLKT